MEAAIVEARKVIAANPRAVSPHRIFWTTWTGWMLDGFDSAAHGLLLVSVWSELLPLGGLEANKPDIAVYGGFGFSALTHLFAAIGPLMIGALAASTGSYPVAITLISTIDVPGIVFIATCRETAGKSLPASATSNRLA